MAISIGAILNPVVVEGQPVPMQSGYISISPAKNGVTLMVGGAGMSETFVFEGSDAAAIAVKVSAKLADSVVA